MVCLNDGRSIRIDAHTGRESVLDLTLVSNTLARKCHWEVWEGSCIGSDHYSIVTSVGIEAERHQHKEGEDGCLEKPIGISLKKEGKE